MLRNTRLMRTIKERMLNDDRVMSTILIIEVITLLFTGTWMVRAFLIVLMVLTIGHAGLRVNAEYLKNKPGKPS